MECGARNIQQYVARCAVLYAKDRDQEMKRLKKRLKGLEGALTYCVRCQNGFVHDPPALSEECTFCSVYKRCQWCPERESVCHMCGEQNACEECMEQCDCEKYVCPKCNPKGELCFFCWITNGHIYVPCSEHPYFICELANGYKVPCCADHWKMRNALHDHTKNEVMLNFFGIIHKLEKRAKIE